MEQCLARDSDSSGVGCDNMTIVVVALLNGKTYEEWQSGIAARVAEESSAETNDKSTQDSALIVPNVVATSESEPASDNLPSEESTQEEAAEEEAADAETKEEESSATLEETETPSN
jgi:hypothetical protein